MELTDHQLKLLKIIDCIRWNEPEFLGPYNHLLIQRAYGQGDPAVCFELQQAVEWIQAWDRNPPPSPEPGPQRSPWMETWDIEWWRIEAIEIEEPDMSWYESGDRTIYGPDGQPAGSM